MKICVLTHTFPRNSSDSAAAFMKEFCDSLVKGGDEVVVVTPFDKIFNRQGDPFKIVTFKYIWPESLHLLGYSRSMEADVTIRKINYPLLPFLIFFGLLKLIKVIKQEKIDLISVHWILPNGLTALIASKLTGIPYVVTLPGTDAYLAGKYKFFGWIAKIIAKNSKGLFSNSKWHLNKILDLGVKVPVEAVITYPVDTNKFHPSKVGVENLRAKYDLKDNLILLAVGRLVYKKGFDYLIKAMPKVVKKLPNVRLLIGGEGDLYRAWKDLSLQQGLEDYVYFIGAIPRDEIAKFYNLADVVVTPSIIDQEGNVDGRPLVILESMACGKSQIVTNLPGISDALTNGVNALLVDQKNSDMLAEAILKLLSSPKLRVEMGEANRKLAVERLSVEKIGERYISFFKKAFLKS